jgi:hypothetical protein
MDKGRFQLRKKLNLIGLGTLLVFMILIGVVKYAPENHPSRSEPQQFQIEAARKEGYERGLKDGYKTAKEETAESYQRGYATARKEVRWQAGMTDFCLVCW